MTHPYQQSELHRQFNAMILLGVVVAVDYDQKQLKLQDGGLTTGWIPFPAQSGRNWKAWHPVKLGQQFIAICRSGDAAQAKIVGELWWDENDSPSTDVSIHSRLFKPGE